MDNMNTDFSIIDEIYLENDDKLRDLKLKHMLLLSDIKNMEQRILEEEEKKDPNRGIFHTVSEHVFNNETDRMRKELFAKKEECAGLELDIFKLEETKQRLHHVKKALYSNILKETEEETDESLQQGMQILMLQEKEQNRIAADLHDSTVQSMTALLHKVELIERFMDIDKTRAFLELSGMKDTIRGMIQEMREIIYDLRPMSLENLGLWMSVKEMLDLVQERHNIQVQYLFEDAVLQYELSEVVEINLFRMIQEIVNNSVKHSGANTIVVSISMKEECLRIEISDNGVGIQECPQSKEKKFGLRILQERATIVNATLTICNGKKCGTEVIIQLPITKESDEM